MKRCLLSFVFFAFLISTLLRAFEQNAWGQLETKATNTGTKSIIKPGVKLRLNNSLQEFGIEALGPEHPNFEDEFKKLSLNENSDKDRALSDAKSSSIFIRNKSEREIVGLALIWTIPISGGREQMSPWRRSNSGALVGIAAIHPNLTGKWSIVKAGATQLFSYTNAEVFKESNRRWNSDRFTPTAVNIDGVVFDDGTFIGPNQSFYFEEISAEVKAKLDFLTLMKTSRRAGNSASQIIDQFLSTTPEDLPTYLYGTPTTRFNSSEDAFEYFYLETMFVIRKGITSNRMKVSDESIVNVLTRPKPEDFKTLRKKS
ncbi:MAG: hypothetical protein WBD27_12715 [Pyrinomonadaceae bacterium]